MYYEVVRSMSKAQMLPETCSNFERNLKVFFLLNFSKVRSVYKYGRVTINLLTSDLNVGIETLFEINIIVLVGEIF